MLSAPPTGAKTHGLAMADAGLQKIPEDLQVCYGENTIVQR